MNWLTVGAGFLVGVIVGIIFMCWMIVRGHNNASAAFNTSPEE